jgi:dUTP pyrophosphatase
MVALKLYKTHPEIILPTFATDQAACFDLSYQGHGKHEYKGYNDTNRPFSRPTPNGTIFINSHERVLVPTGIIMDIPKGYSVRIHARSGLSLKEGLILANSEAVIDSDYVDEIFVLIYNRSTIGRTISIGERIAQAELVKSIIYKIEETKDRPSTKTNRTGGLGSTGV